MRQYLGLFYFLVESLECPDNCVKAILIDGRSIGIFLFLPIYQMTQEFKKPDMLLLLSKILFNFISASAFHQLIILKIIHRFYF